MEQYEISDTSIYDFLGKAGGSKLGKLVYKEARDLFITVNEREVQHKGFTGKVLLYPRSFLQEFFRRYPNLRK